MSEEIGCLSNAFAILFDANRFLCKFNCDVQKASKAGGIITKKWVFSCLEIEPLLGYIHPKRKRKFAYFRQSYEDNNDCNKTLEIKHLTLYVYFI